MTDANVLEYTYNSDKLIKVGEEKIEYAETELLGNPSMYKGHSLVWNNLRNLSKFGTIEFTYNANGIRTKKVNGNHESKYYYLDNRLLSEKRDIHSSDLNVNDYLYEGEIYYTYTDKTDISYMYNANELTSFTITKQGQNETYYYRKNLQGDITHIYDKNANLKAEYVYDAWGNYEIVTNVDNIANINPFRYRGYYYDTETGLYYLQSRYYDPQTGRFINADAISILDESKNLINGLNLFAYCGNNPVMNIDPSGEAWWHWLVGAIAVIGLIVATVVTAGGFAGAAAAMISVMSGVGASSMGLSILAGATMLATATFGASLIVAGGMSVNSWSNGGTLNDGINVAMGYGETAMWSTIGSGVFGGLLGGFAYAASNPTTKLYRSVSNEEYRSIKSTGKFSTKLGSYEGKQFGFNKIETIKFGNNFGQNKIISIKIPTNQLKIFDFTPVDGHIFKHGTFTVHYSLLEFFNNIIRILK